MQKFYYYAATQAGVFWELKIGHVFVVGDEPWVCTGFNADYEKGGIGVWIAHKNRIILVSGNTTLWESLSVRRMSPTAAKGWNKK